MLRFLGRSLTNHKQSYFLIDLKLYGRHLPDEAKNLLRLPTGKKTLSTDAGLVA